MQRMSSSERRAVRRAPAARWRAPRRSALAACAARGGPPPAHADGRLRRRARSWSGSRTAARRWSSCRPGPRSTSGRGARARARRCEFAAPNWIARASLTPLDQGTAGTPGGWAGRPVELPRPARAGSGSAGLGPARSRPAPPAASGRPSPSSTPGSPTPPPRRLRGRARLRRRAVRRRHRPGRRRRLPLDENGHGTHVAGTIAEQVTLDAALSRRRLPRPGSPTAPR